MAEDKLVEEATVVHDDVQDPEKANEELVMNVAKKLGRDEWGDDLPEEEAQTEEAQEEDTPSESPEEPDELPAPLQARAEKAGLSQELAEKLHQSGQLEETLAAFDRVMIQRMESKDESVEKPEVREETPPTVDLDDLPELDPDEYDEVIIKRDQYHKRRIDALESQLSGLLDQLQGDFVSRFDATVDSLEQDDLFGQGAQIADDKQVNRDKLFKAYQKVCEAIDVDPRRCDPEVVSRALAVVFPDAKKDQGNDKLKNTVSRARDAEGKFIPSAKTNGKPPSSSDTPEGAHQDLVSDVAMYLKKNGVQMSGL